MKWKAELARLRAELAARDAAAVDAIAQAYEDGRISACNAGKPGCPRVAALEAECARLRETLVLTYNWIIGDDVDSVGLSGVIDSVTAVLYSTDASKPKEPNP